MRGVKIPDDRIIQTLMKHHGLVSISAKALGLSREALSSRVNNDPDLKMVLDDAREFNTDEAESQLFKAIRNGEAWAIRYYLSCLGKRRGYVERMEHTGPDGEPIQLEAVVRTKAELFLKQMNKLVADQGVVIDVEAKESHSGNGAQSNGTRVVEST